MDIRCQHATQQKVGDSCPALTLSANRADSCFAHDERGRREIEFDHGGGLDKGTR